MLNITPLHWLSICGSERSQIEVCLTQVNQLCRIRTHLSVAVTKHYLICLLHKMSTVL